MIDKYGEIDIYELENGYVLKRIDPTIPHSTSQPAYTSEYCKDVDSLVEQIKEILNKKWKKL